MNRDLFDIAQKLQAKLNSISPEVDPASLIWAHGFLTGLVENLASHIPELADSGPRDKSGTDPSLRRSRKFRGRQDGSSIAPSGVVHTANSPSTAAGFLKELRDMQLMGDEPDSLERLMDELDQSDPTETTSVPANLRPGPEGLVGGVALPLPTDSDYKM